jgi:uncharacterized protein (DUF488 family)
MVDPPPDVFTIGHSNRSFDEFLELLVGHGIELVADVRAFPGSRRLPHFGSEPLAAALQDHDIGYRHLRDLGGRRRATTDAPPELGDAWRNGSFRAYAQYTHTAAYREALDELMQLARHDAVAIMCSEAVPWRCHRWLISDTLVAMGARVLHVIDAGPARQHLLSSFAHVDGVVVTWPGPESTAPLALGPRVAGASASRAR